MREIALKWLMLVWVLAGLLPTSSALAASGTPEARMTATVVEFSVRGELHEQAGAIIADLMMSALANTGRFTLKDRLALSAAAKIAKQQELGSTGLLDPQTAAELGRRYGVDAVVTGGVNKLGDLITVTARLIDTKTASLLRSGQIQGRDIDTIQIKVNELAAMITMPPEPPEPPPAYGLTVKTQPPDASIRLLNSPIPYQPGVRLPPGNYVIEVGRSGYIANRETVKIDDRDLAVTIELEKTKYSLTVRPDPADAQIQLLGAPAAYQPGVELPPGNYEIEVTREGYVSRKLPVQMVNSDRTIPVKLEKQPPPPLEQYRLTVQADPAQATIRLLNEKTPYRPGVELPPGEYTVEVSHPGYEAKKVEIAIVNSEVETPVTLTKLPEPEKPATYRLTVRPDPSNARIRILNIQPRYQPGIALTPGAYTVEVSRPGYETRISTVRITDRDVTLPVTLTQQPEPEPTPSYRLTVRTDPSNAQIRLLGIRSRYQPGIELNPGVYRVEVSRSGYETQTLNVRITDRDVTESITLTQTAKVTPSQPPATPATPPTAPPSRAGAWRIGSLQIDGSITGVDRSEVQRVLNRYVGQTVTRDNLLNGAIQIYRTTGITVNFVVRNSASGSAQLQTRVSRRLRRTYESSIPLVTRSQIERSGFGVSVE